MAMSNLRPSETELRRWAAQRLDLSDQASPEEARPALFLRLAAEEFVPPERWQQALEIWNGRPASDAVLAQAALQAEERLRTEVEQFALEFFRLPPGQRAARWQQLAERAAPLPHIRARLMQLKPGVSIDPEAFAPRTPRSAQLAKDVLELFTLPATERCEKQAFLMEGITGHEVEWEAAAHSLMEIAPQVAALQSYYLQQLAYWTQTKKRIARKRRYRARCPWAVGKRPPEPKMRDLAILVGYILAVLIVMGRLASLSSPPRPSTPPHLEVPDNTVFQFPDPGGGKTDEEKEQMANWSKGGLTGRSSEKRPTLPPTNRRDQRPLQSRELDRMSEHSLSDDLSGWPTNPHELLGVTRDVSPRDLRRAYAR